MSRYDHPELATLDKRQRRKCKAKSSRTGLPCKHYAIMGGAVCLTHGGRAPQVKRKAAERIANLIDPDRALREAARIAYSDTGALFDEKGNLRPIGEWPAQLRRAVAGVEVVKRNLTAGDGEVDQVLKVKFWDKTKALEMLFKHLGLLKERVEHSGGLEIKWQD